MKRKKIPAANIRLFQLQGDDDNFECGALYAAFFVYFYMACWFCIGG